MLMKTRKPSEASLKAHREWEAAVEDLQALQRTHRGRAFRHGKAHQMSPEDKALKASLEATIKRLDPVIKRDFPL